MNDDENNGDENEVENDGKAEPKPGHLVLSPKNGHHMYNILVTDRIL